MDLIERQVAIRKLKRMATQAYIDKLNGSAETVINCCIDVIERQIPSAQPEPCKDAVSRVDVLECFSDLYDTFEDCSKGIVNELHRKFEDLRTLPSVTPKQRTGKWTKDCACEICGFKPWYERDIHTLSFCPNCGADLREDQTDDNRPG